MARSKLFIFRSSRSVSAFIGSANATSAAFAEHNEEILLELRRREVSPELLAYVDEVANHGITLDDVSPREIDNIAQWYREGVCYYKPNASFGLRFPLLFPEGLAAKLSSSELDRIAGVGRDQTNLTYNLTANLNTAAERKGRTVIAAIGIQTCYGWWVPSAYTSGDNGFDRKLQRAAAARQRHVDRKCQRILRAYENGNVRSHAHRAFSRLKRLSGGKWPLAKDDVHGRFDAFLQKAVERLNDTRWRKRVAAVYAGASVPEI